MVSNQVIKSLAAWGATVYQLIVSFDNEVRHKGDWPFKAKFVNGADAKEPVQLEH